MMDSRLRGNDGQDLCIGMLMRKPCLAALPGCLLFRTGRLPSFIYPSFVTVKG